MPVDLSLIAIDVADWIEDEEYPYFPEGSRDKRLLICPEVTDLPLLIAHHRYQFKQSRPVYPEQFWAEVVAYQIGLLAGVRVPPAYPAWDSSKGICGSLIEWFYGFPNRPTDGFLSGGLFMKAIIKDYDLARGRQHNFESIQRICTVLQQAGDDAPSKLGADWPHAWAQMLTFDALIGNTDRHHENWGFLLDRSPAHPRPNTLLAPAFDNGTSLGHEFSTHQFGKFDDPQVLARYIHRGRHHLRWDARDEDRCGHADMLLKIAQQYPKSLTSMHRVLGFDAAALEQVLLALTEARLPIPLSPARARFMLRLVLARRDYLLNALPAL